MALSHGKVWLGRDVLILLLYLKLIFIFFNVVSSIVWGHWTLMIGILLTLLIVTLHIIGMISFGHAWKIGKRHYYSYTWFGYTGLLIVDIIVVLTPYLLFVDAEQDIPFLRTIFCQSSLYHTIYFATLFEHCWRRKHRISWGIWMFVCHNVCTNIRRHRYDRQCFERLWQWDTYRTWSRHDYPCFWMSVACSVGVFRTSESLTRKRERSEGSSTYRVDSRSPGNFDNSSGGLC